MTIAPTASRPSRRLRAIAAAPLLLVALGACDTSARPSSSDSARAATSTTVSMPPAAGTAASSPAVAPPLLVVYKTPSCGCCKGWVKAMESAGFKTEIHDVADLAPVKHAAGVPAELQACHTARIGGYVVEGHVPPEDVRRLLAERPDIAGIATPGMPVGSPGMEGAYKDHYDVMTFGGSARSTVFAAH